MCIRDSYPNIQDRLLSSQAYEEYTTVAVRALTGLDEWKTPENATKLEEWIAKIRGTEFEAEAPLHALFTADAGDLDSMHCAEMTTATLQHMGLLSSRLVAGTAPPCAYADAHARACARACVRVCVRVCVHTYIPVCTGCL